MLCITRHERMSIITMSGLCHVQLELIPFCPTPQYRIALSWELLAWITVNGRIPRSFTNFITSPELSGPLYISPDIYFSQITEYLLEKTYHHQWVLFSLHRTSSNCYSARPSSPCPSLRALNPLWSVREHLSRALPTEKIFYLLRSIPSEHLSDYSAESMPDMLEVIIKWLQVSVIEWNRQTSHTKNPICA